MCHLRDIKSRNLRWKKQEVLKCTLYRNNPKVGKKERARFRVKQMANHQDNKFYSCQ